jgi:hypothetical protein
MKRGVFWESAMKMRLGNIVGVAILAGLAGCHGGSIGSGPMEMLEDRGVPNVSTVDVGTLDSYLGRDVKVFGTAIATKWSLTSVRDDNGRIWSVQIRALDAWPEDVLGRRVHVKGVLQLREQLLDAAGRPVEERGNIVQGPGRQHVYYLADCVYERS